MGYGVALSFSRERLDAWRDFGSCFLYSFLIPIFPVLFQVMFRYYLVDPKIPFPNQR